MTQLTDQLRALANHQHSDLSIAGDAADKIEQLCAALVHVEAVMSIVEPRSSKAEYLETLAEVRATVIADHL